MNSKCENMILGIAETYTMKIHKDNHTLFKYKIWDYPPSTTHNPTQIQINNTIFCKTSEIDILGAIPTYHESQNFIYIFFLCAWLFFCYCPGSQKDQYFMHFSGFLTPKLQNMFH